MVNDRDAPIEHLSINMLSAVLEPMINNAVTNSVYSIQSELNTHSSQISSLQQENTELKQAFITQAKQFDSQRRRKNLIIHGLEHTLNEDYASLQNSIINLLCEQLGVDFSINDINFARRIGKRASDHVSPILLSLTSQRKKLDILNASHKLKGSEVSIANDYSKEVLATRKSLLPLVKALKEKGILAQLRDDEIFIDKKRCSTSKAESLLQSLITDRKRDRSTLEEDQVLHQPGTTSLPATFHLHKKNKENFLSKTQSTKPPSRTKNSTLTPKSNNNSTPQSPFRAQSSMQSFLTPTLPKTTNKTP